MVEIFRHRPYKIAATSAPPACGKISLKFDVLIAVPEARLPAGFFYVDIHKIPTFIF